MWRFYHSMQLQYKALVYLPKNLGKESKRLKLLKNDHFSEAFGLLSANLDHKAQSKPSHMQLNVSFL